MAITSLTELAAAGARQSLNKSSSKLNASISHIASGQRITQAMEDIASLSVATSLQSQVTGLRGAALNVAQATSMLQVADGGMNQIGDMLQRLQSLAVQSNSGVLDASTRKALNTEFQNLTQEIDRISGNTNFNGVNLLDGNLSSGKSLQTTDTNASAASGSLNFTANIAAGKTIVLNGQTFTEGVNFNAGATIQQTVDNLATALNGSTNNALSGANYTRSGNSLVITNDAGGSLGNNFTINQGASTAGASFSVAGQQVGAAPIFSLQGGSDNGLSAGSTTASGVVGDSLVTAQSQTPATSTINFNSSADIVAGNTISIDNGNGGFVNFTYVNGAPANNTQIQIGATLEDTLQNTASTLKNYTGTDDYGIRQLDFTINGNSLEITNKDTGNPLDVAGAALNVNQVTAGGTISNTTLNNGSTGGVDVSNVTNAAFTGQIQGFTTQFNSANNVTASIKVGNETYTANIANTNNAANQTVRFTSANGGSFDVQLAGGQGQNVASQSDANTFASRLDSALSGLNFSQNRNVSNFTAAGQLNGASLEIQGSNFSGPLKVDSVSVTTQNGNATFEVKINGETFRASNLGQSIGANESIKLTSLSNSNNILTFNNGANQINLSTPQNAQTFQTNFSNAVGAGSGGASFQIGSGADDISTLNINSVNSSSLFGGQNIDILSASSASSAFAVVADAINRLTAARADVGAFQQSLYYTGNNIDVAIQNQEAARSNLLDTDIASESTLLASATVQSQAATAAIAQTNRMSSSILKLLVN